MMRTRLLRTALALLACVVLTIGVAGCGKQSHAPSLKSAAAVRGKDVFRANCGGCHMIKDAGSHGDVGPNLDDAGDLTRALVRTRVNNGRGHMPAFRDQLTKQEIADVTTYVLAATA